MSSVGATIVWGVFSRSIDPFNTLELQSDIIGERPIYVQSQYHLHGAAPLGKVACKFLVHSLQPTSTSQYMQSEPIQHHIDYIEANWAS